MPKRTSIFISDNMNIRAVMPVTVITNSPAAQKGYPLRNKLQPHKEDDK